MSAVIAVKPPWYRRLFGRQRALAAGQRPDYMGRPARGSGVGRRLFLLLIALALVGALASYFVVPEVRERVDSMVADGRRAWDTFRNPGGNALDDDVATYWLADTSGDTPSVSVNFSDTINLVTATFHSGAGSGDEFTRYRRPRTVEFSHPGGGRPVRIVLRDDAAAQEHDLELPGVRALEMRILDFYGGASEGEVLVALREVEFTSSR